MESLLEYPLIITGISINYTDVPTGVCAVYGEDGTSRWYKQSSATGTCRNRRPER